MKVWITKYALTHGVLQVEAEIDSVLIQMIHFPQMANISSNSYVYGEGREWHRTETAAKIKAETMRRARIEALKKQIAKLEALRF